MGFKEDNVECSRFSTVEKKIPVLRSNAKHARHICHRMASSIAEHTGSIIEHSESVNMNTVSHSNSVRTMI